MSAKLLLILVSTTGLWKDIEELCIEINVRPVPPDFAAFTSHTIPPLFSFPTFLLFQSTTFTHLDLPELLQVQKAEHSSCQ